MLLYSSRLLRLPSVRVKPVIKVIRAHSSAVESRYADKVQQRLAERGFTDIEQYKKRTCSSAPHPQSVERARVVPRPAASTKATSPLTGRKDSPPVLPLSDIMDLAKIMKTPHTAEQIGALWTAYHAAKSQSPSAKIYLSATIPTATYERLLSKAVAYPCFVLPLPRPDAQIKSAPDATDASTAQGTPYEFYFVQWSMHGSPPTPSSDGLPPLFNNQPSSPSQTVPNSSCTTVLFTSLQEYKLRQDYATPHLVLTHYTDLAQSHGLVLFRGELTPLSSGQSTVLSPDDAQRLALLLQQFYLPPRENDERGAARAKLLQRFHEEPEAFRWEDLVDSVVQ